MLPEFPASPWHSACSWGCATPKKTLNRFLGEGDEGHYFIAIDKAGRVFLVMDFLMYVAETFESALENLLLGRKSRLVDENGHY
jgi:hypothetical protein